MTTTAISLNGRRRYELITHDHIGGRSRATEVVTADRPRQLDGLDQLFRRNHSLSRHSQPVKKDHQMIT